MDAPSTQLKKEPSGRWSRSAPTEPGLYWLYGEADFGSMGGNYTGVYPPEAKLNFVQVQKIGGGVLMAICNGQFISLKPFNLEKRTIGYHGVWQAIELPALPTNDNTDL